MDIRAVRVCYLLVCGLSLITQAAIVVEGNTQGATSFTFALGPSARSAPGGSFFVSSLFPDVAQEFAIARTFEGTACFDSFAPEMAFINGTQQSNPVYNAAVTQLGAYPAQVTIGTNVRTMYFPFAVIADRPADIFAVTDIVQGCVSMLALSEIKDADPAGGQTTREIISLAPFVNSSGATEAFFLAVKPHNNDMFGQPFSGIAVTQFTNVTVDDCPRTILMQINAYPDSQLPDTEPLASPLNITSPSVKIGGNVTSISNMVDMHFSAKLQRLYVAMQVEGGPNAQDGARAVVVGRLEDKKLTFTAIAPDAVFTAMNKIVGGTGSSAQVSIEKVRTMFTSTSLDYLIVLGNNGAPDTTQQTVFALPLVDTIVTGSVNQEIQGTLANVLVAPEDIFSPQKSTCEANPQLFLGRVFPQAATESDQVYTNASVQAQVGGGPLAVGPITDINVVKDAVFVSVADPLGNQKPGIFYSQALFAADGSIADWTPWQRVAGTTDSVFAFSYEPELGSFLWLTGQSAISVDTAKRTEWGFGSADGLASLVEIMPGLLPPACGGVQGFFDMPPNTPGLFDISLFIATGNNAVVLIESGQVENGVLCPNGGDFQINKQLFTDGMITETFPVGPVRIVSISGGVLEQLGPIIAASLGVNASDEQGHLFVGGACGLAVLAQEDGTGWSTTNGLGKNFVGLTQGMRFIELGDYCFVRKLIFDEGFLYVLTDTRLDRIDVAASNFATGDLSLVTVATLDAVCAQEHGTLLDLLVSGKFALLAASTGFFRIANDADIQTAVEAEGLWQSIVIPEGQPVVQALQAVAATIEPNGFAKQGTSNVYINDAYRGYNWAQNNRYRVTQVNDAPITDDTIQPLPDITVKDALRAFKTYRNYRTFTLYDGADCFSVRNKVYGAPPVVFNNFIRLPLDIDDASVVSALVRSSASGAWLVAGDFGLRVNE